ncbi:MAG: hypothetical protein WDA26_10775 [Pusillimonas sp.]
MKPAIPSQKTGLIINPDLQNIFTSARRGYTIISTLNLNHAGALTQRA